MELGNTAGVRVKGKEIEDIQIREGDARYRMRRVSRGVMSCRRQCQPMKDCRKDRTKMQGIVEYLRKVRLGSTSRKRPRSENTSHNIKINKNEEELISITDLRFEIHHSKTHCFHLQI